MILQTNIRAMKKTLVLIAAAVGLTLAAQPALAAGGESKPLRSGGFSFEGPFGSFDQDHGPFDTLHVDWDVPPFGIGAPPLPADNPDAEDLIEVPQ